MPRAAAVQPERRCERAGRFTKLLAPSKEILRRRTLDFAHAARTAAGRQPASSPAPKEFHVRPPFPLVPSTARGLPRVLALPAVLAAGACSRMRRLGPGHERGGQRTAQEQQAETKLADFARCMREHGVDAETVSRPRWRPRLKISPGRAGAGPAAMEGAQKACARYRPEPKHVNLSPQQKVQREEQVQKFAKCMREHGIKVEASTAGGGIQIGIHAGPGSGGPNPESPGFQAAQNACQSCCRSRPRAKAAPAWAPAPSRARPNDVRPAARARARRPSPAEPGLPGEPRSPRIELRRADCRPTAPPQAARPAPRIGALLVAARRVRDRAQRRPGAGPITRRHGRAGRATRPPTVTRRTLTESSTVDGTLGYGSTLELYDRLAGTFTWLPRGRRDRSPRRHAVAHRQPAGGADVRDRARLSHAEGGRRRRARRGRAEPQPDRPRLRPLRRDHRRRELRRSHRRGGEPLAEGRGPARNRDRSNSAGSSSRPAPAASPQSTSASARTRPAAKAPNRPPERSTPKRRARERRRAEHRSTKNPPPRNHGQKPTAKKPTPKKPAQTKSPTRTPRAGNRPTLVEQTAGDKPSSKDPPAKKTSATKPQQTRRRSAARARWR